MRYSLDPGAMNSVKQHFPELGLATALSSFPVSLAAISVVNGAAASLAKSATVLAYVWAPLRYLEPRTKSQAGESAPSAGLREYKR